MSFHYYMDGDIFDVNPYETNFFHRFKTHKLNQVTIKKLIKTNQFDKLKKYHQYNFQDLTNQKVLTKLLEGCKSSQIIIHIVHTALSLECEDEYGRNLLQIFIKYGAPNQAILHLIDLINPEDLEHQDQWLFRPIHYACRYGNNYIIQKLMNHKVDLECVTQQGSLPIHLACIKQNIKTLDLLLSRVTVDGLDNEGLCALDKICRYRNIHMIEYVAQKMFPISSLDRTKKMIDQNDQLSSEEKEYAKGLIISII